MAPNLKPFWNFKSWKNSHSMWDKIVRILTFFQYLFLIMCMCVHVVLWAHVHTVPVEARGGPWSYRQVCVGLVIWALGTNLRSSARAINAPNYWAISPAHRCKIVSLIFHSLYLVSSWTSILRGCSLWNIQGSEFSFSLFF